MSAIVTKLSDQTYPGFDEFKKYFSSCAAAFPRYAPDINSNSDTITFWGEASAMQDVLNTPEFRLMWNLLPAGMDAVTAFVQVYALKYPKHMSLDGMTGTYTLRVNIWNSLWEEQNEAQYSQQHRYAFSVKENRRDTLLTICL